MDPNLDPQIPAELEPIVADATAPEHIVAEPPAPQIPLARRIFFGPFGLRAGWSLLIYIAIIASIIFSVNRVMHHMKVKRDQQAAAQSTTSQAKPPAPKPDLNAPAPLKPMIVAEAIAFAALFLISWLMAAIERRPVGCFGLGGGRPFLRRFLVGLFWGLAAQSVLIVALRSFHLLSFDTRLLHGRAIFFWGAVQFLAFLLVGFVEEYLFRGYIQFTLTRGMVCIGNLISPTHSRAIGFWIASIITSALFYKAHTGNSGENLAGLIMVFLAGITFVVALWRTGSLWWAIGFHAAWDWAQSFLYGVPDSGGLMQGRLFATHAMGNPLYSGGTVGPEGSLLCIPILILVIAVLFFTHPSPQPPLETLPPKIKPSTGNSQLPSETNPLIA